MPNADGKTISLVMIVKDESHVIRETLENLWSYIQFDSYYVCDTGSSDNTKEIIKTFFDSKKISGEIVDDPWQDFGTNRSAAFALAYKKSDYAFVWDADDRIEGQFKLPSVLDKDEYRFIFGNPAHTYSRAQLFNNQKRWVYVGVLHEYPRCEEARGPAELVNGAYFFQSNRSGARNKDPKKYEKDAAILDAAFQKAVAAGDPIKNRYAFYCAQSYNCCNQYEKAIEFYKKVIAFSDQWWQEKYMACIEIFQMSQALSRTDSAISYCIESFTYDQERIEGIYRATEYYFNKQQYETAWRLSQWVWPAWSSGQWRKSLPEKLFAKSFEYSYWYPILLLQVAEKVGRRQDVFGPCWEQLQRLELTQWNPHLFQHAVQCLALYHQMLDASFFTWLDRIRAHLNWTPSTKWIQALQPLVDRLRKEAEQPCSIVPTPRPDADILFTMTTCKRVDLFERTMRSIVNSWTDTGRIREWIIIDDNSTEEDRAKMLELFPWIRIVKKTPEEKGHRQSMNKIWDILKEAQAAGIKYWVHMEDDWVFYRPEDYINRAVQLLQTHSKAGVKQVVFNKDYAVVWDDADRVGSIPLPASEGKPARLHQHKEGIVGKNCGYWPHYSLQPSLTELSAILEIGNYDGKIASFEKEYGHRYAAAGFQTAFFDGIFSIHIGKQHWEKTGQNAYALNGIQQFGSAPVEMATTEFPGWLWIPNRDSISGDTSSLRRRPTAEDMATALNTQGIVAVNSWGYQKHTLYAPLKQFGGANDGIWIRRQLTGTMRQHLDRICFMIDAKLPFAVIRPSDGEYKILLNQTLTNCDHWTFQKGGKLRQDLLAAVQIRDPNVYIGTPCDRCNVGFCCNSVVYNTYRKTLQIPDEQLTYADVFMNGNWEPFMNYLKGKPAYVIGPGGRDVTEMNVKGRMILSQTLVNDWDTKGDQAIADVLDFTKDLSGELVLFSAGPLAKVFVARAWQANPRNQYLDVGAALDLWTKGKTTRFYTDPTHPSNKGTCLFKPQPANWLQPKKQMVYFSVHASEKYLELLRMALLTVKLFSDIRTIDIWVYTDPSFTQTVYSMAEEFSLPVRVVWPRGQPVDATIFDAALSRLRIFEEPDTMKYEKVLYLDTDILVRGDLAKLFEEVLEEGKVYAVEEGSLGHPAFGRQLFEESGRPFNRTQKGLNSGILLFRPSEKIQTIFASALASATAWRKAKRADPPCMDQGFINFAVISNGAMDRSGLVGKYAALFDDNYVCSNHDTVTLCHFSWPMGDFENKKKRMDDYLNYILRYWNPRDAPAFPADWDQKSWKWGGGFIQVFQNNTLTTPWGQGFLTMLGPTTFRALWRGYLHVVSICPEGVCMFAVRAGDLVLCNTPMDHDAPSSTCVTEYLNRKGFYTFEGYSEQVPKQVEDLANFAKAAGVKRILEIGFNAGHSAETFLKANPDAEVVSFDLGEHAYGKAAKEYIDMKYPGRHTVLWGDSTQTIPSYTGKGDFDLLFIDGGHSHEIALADLQNCWRLARADAVVVLDDTNYTAGWIHPVNTGIINAWKKVIAEGKIVEDGKVDYTYARGITWGRYVR